MWCVHLLLRRGLDEACRDVQTPLNPARLCAVPQTEEHQTIPLRLGQLQRYLNAAEKLGTLPIIYTGLTSGLRQCELLTLSWAVFYVPCRYIRKGKRLLALNDKMAHDYVFKNHILPGLGDMKLAKLMETEVGAFMENRKRFGSHRPESANYPGLGDDAMRHTSIGFCNSAWSKPWRMTR